jgi:hypothetical protein
MKIMLGLGDGLYILSVMCRETERSFGVRKSDCKIGRALRWAASAFMEFRLDIYQDLQTTTRKLLSRSRP